MSSVNPPVNPVPTPAPHGSVLDTLRDGFNSAVLETENLAHEVYDHIRATIQGTAAATLLPKLEATIAADVDAMLNTPIPAGAVKLGDLLNADAQAAVAALKPALAAYLAKLIIAAGVGATTP